MNKKLLRMIAMVMLAAFALGFAQVAFAAPFNAKISKTKATIDMAQGNTLTLTSNVPANLQSQVQWKSNKVSVATVNNGVVTAKKPGVAQVGVRVKGGKWSVCKVTVTNGSAPKKVLLSTASKELALGETLTILASVTPSAAVQTVVWKSNKPAVASVSPTGVVTAKKAGTALIRASSTQKSNVYKTVTIRVVDAKPPSKVVIELDDTSLNVGEKVTLSTAITPAGANGKITWSSSNTAIATVSSSGVVTAKKAGKAVITATSAVKKTVKATKTITVEDPNAVDKISITQTDMYMDVKKYANLTATVTPASSKATVSWSSNNTSVVSVTSAGRVTANSVGTAVITAKAGTKTDNVEIRVLSDERESTLPDKYVASSSAIDANHKKINALYKSALEELEMHVAKKNISVAERANRKEMLQRGFIMYDVPWSSDRAVKYWSGSTSYLKDRIYFGMPYTQYKRTFNLDKWLSAVSYSKADGHYKVKGMIDTNYPGNDCSSYVSMIQYGTNDAASYLNSTAMRTSTKYTTVSDGFSSLVPGDVLVKNGHVALFLYYVTSDRIMVLEQGGGSEPNTTACHIKSISGTYRAQGYIVRRKVGVAS